MPVDDGRYALRVDVGGRLVVRGARWPGDVTIAGGRITAVGDVAALPGDRVLRADGDIVTAGLVNAHHHLFQWMTRGRAVSCDLFGWLTELYPVWARLSVDDVRAAALVGLAELARSGRTTAADHHYLVPHGDDTVFDAIAEAARTVGLRIHLARGSMDLGESDGGLPPDDVVEDVDAIAASTESVIARLHDGERCTVTVAPCSPFTVSETLMRTSADLARRHGLRLHTHLAETVAEERDAVARFGRQRCSTTGGGSPTTSGWRTRSTSTTTRSPASVPRGPASPTARRRTRAWVPGSAV